MTATAQLAVVVLLIDLVRASEVITSTVLTPLSRSFRKRLGSRNTGVPGCPGVDDDPLTRFELGRAADDREAVVGLGEDTLGATT